ncbi:MAG: hypothetical protein WBG41_16525 [Acidimicrobiales bacterium]
MTPRQHPSSRQHRIGRRSSSGLRRRVALALSLILVSAASSVGVSLVVSGSATPNAGAAQTSSCTTGTSDGAGGCEVSLPCPPSPIVCNPSTPPTADIGPVTYLQDGQYVSIKATNFPNSGFADGASGGDIRIAFCSTVSPNPKDPDCLFGTWESEVFAQIANEEVNTTNSDDETDINLPVFLEPRGQGDPIPGKPVTGPFSGPNQGFYCDDTTDPCAIEVTWEEQSNAAGTNTGVGSTSDPYDSSANTVVMPLSFAPQASGCPSTDDVFTSESTYAFQHFLDTAVGATCQGSNGVVDFDVGTDTTLAVQDFASSDQPLVFVDNPADPAQEAELLGGRSFAYIPIAVSATTVGFLGDNQQASSPLGRPIQSYDLTPTMLAGILNGDYQTPIGSYSGPGKIVKGGIFYSDNLLAALQTAGAGCSEIVGCTPPPGTPKKDYASALLADEQTMNSFNLLNPVPAGVQSRATQAVPNGAYAPIAATGTIWQASSWICQQPAEPMTLQVPENTGPDGSTVITPVTVTDTNPSPTELANTPHNGPLANINPATGVPYWEWPTDGCSSQSTLPPAPETTCIPGQCPVYNLAQYTLPNQEANELREFVYGVGGFNSPNLYPQPEQYGLGFALMDSSESLFYGLDLADMLNSSGQFVGPTTTSVEDALENETPCPAAELSCPLGTYSFDYAKDKTVDAAGAYPMPDITYALVPTAPQAPAQAKAMKDLLTNLVDVSNGDGAAPLPPGYYPLPTSMYQTALGDINSDITAAPSTPTTTPTTTPVAVPPGSVQPTSQPSTATDTSPGSSGSTSPFDSGSPDDQTLPLSSPSSSSSSSSPSSQPSSTAKGSSSPGGSGGGSTGLNGTTTSLVSLNAVSRLLLPALVVLAVLSLVTGAALLLAPDLRRRRRMRRSP